LVEVVRKQPWQRKTIADDVLLVMSGEAWFRVSTLKGMEWEVTRHGFRMAWELEIQKQTCHATSVFSV
jgi:hypothetical protein